MLIKFFLNNILALIILLISCPFLIFIFILILLDNGLPILFKQKRIGLDNKVFIIYKFRTMKLDTPDIATHLLESNKSLYTYFGPFLRKYSIDEIPQLINIIKGEMAFIGPRPALYNQVDLINLRNKYNIYSLKPGVTGWAQVNGRDELSISEKVEMDKFYLQNKSIYLNIKILFFTIIKAVKAESVKS
jgi:O-antigen biosynthesis protein WbqP